MIEVKQLTVQYGNKIAVDDITFDVKENEIFGIIGENGAGKTTTTECIEGIRKFNKGSISIDGLDVKAHLRDIQKIIGVQLQETNYPKRIKVKELCELFSSFYNHPLDYKDLLNQFNLEEFKDKYVETLSGGQKQRLTIILALLHQPKVIFLDELTTGLDPRSRRNMWDFILHLKENGATIVMTTHFMEEAEYLCDRVAVLNQGKIVALDTVPNLIKKLDYEEKVRFITKGSFDEAILDIKEATKVVRLGKEIVIYGEKGVSDLVRRQLDQHQVTYLHYRSSLPNLEDVFFEFTNEGSEE